MVFIVVLLVVAVVVLVGWLLSVLRSRRNLFVMLRDTRLERDRAEARMHICEHSSDMVKADYEALKDECASLKERLIVAEGKLSRKGLGVKGSKRS